MAARYGFVYGFGLLKGLRMTLRHFFKPPITVQFPEEVRNFPGRARTSLLWFDERCTGCSTCAQACPDGCILVATEPREDGSLNKVRYEIDFRICMYCGLCTEACPYEAIQPGGTFRDAVYFFDDMYHDKYELTRLAHEHLQQQRLHLPQRHEGAAIRHRLHQRGGRRTEPAAAGRHARPDPAASPGRRP